MRLIFFFSLFFALTVFAIEDRQSPTVSILAENQIDKAYETYMRGLLYQAYPDRREPRKSYFCPKAETALDYLNHRKLSNFYTPSLDEVKYCDSRGQYFEEFNKSSYASFVNHDHSWTALGQGWKLHISARPESALKIARIVIPILNRSNANFKMIKSIPLMRHLYLTRFDTKNETQSGKFITIYPHNMENAKALAHEINEAFMDEIQKGKIDPSKDFFLNKGDAQVGMSGGLFVRYGEFYKGYLRKVNPQYKNDNSIYIPYKDNRKIPWPDFMNKNNASWEDEPNPFGNLTLQWKSPDSDQWETWNNRPMSWNQNMGRSKKQTPGRPIP